MNTLVVKFLSRDAFFLPFDSLLMHLTEEQRSKAVDKFTKSLESLPEFQPRLEPLRKFTLPDYGKTLRLGFIGFDFNDHPTAHMLEGIFSTIYHAKKCNKSECSRKFDHIKLYIYNYGKNDNSTFRRKLMEAK